MFNHKYRYLFILILSLFTYLNTELCRVYYYFNIEVKWYYALATITMITFCTWEANRLIQYLFEKKSDSQKNKFKVLAIFFFAGCIATIITTTFIVLTISSLLDRNTYSELVVPLKLNLIYASLANLLFHLMNAITFYFKKYKTTWMKAEEFKRMSSQAELQAIKNQVNPHFLFNNLNVLSSLVLQNNTEANRFIEEFSKVYRYILNNQEKEVIELSTELHYIENYIFLLQKRFTEGLQVSIDVPLAYRNLQIVPAALQMLIENAIKHNIVSRHKPLLIDIQVYADNTLMISNNIQPKQTIEQSTGIGLQNIVKRYGFISDRKVVISNFKNSFTVILPLIAVN